MCMIVERNDGSTTKGKKRITLFAINCGRLQVLKWTVAEVEHWNWLLKKSNVNVKTNSHKKYDK
jgi:S-methylmethionine-dependent homocysteine/selenocysteine methylase